jgi:hypothetical protein
VTHQAIAQPCACLTEVAKTGPGKPVELEGQYEATDDEFMGRLPCPFRDNFKSEKRITTVRIWPPVRPWPGQISIST